MLQFRPGWAHQPHLRLTIVAPKFFMCSQATSKPAQLGLRLSHGASGPNHIKIQLRVPGHPSRSEEDTGAAMVCHHLDIRDGRTSLHAGGTGIDCVLGAEDLPTPYFRRRLERLADARSLPSQMFRPVASVQLMAIGRYGYNPASRDVMEALEQAMVAIEMQTINGVTMCDLAAQIGMTASEFSKRFKQKLGCSPYAYFNVVRMGEAHASLSTSDQTLADTAYSLGYSSQAHFTTAFKRQTGLPPGEYRERMQQLN